MSKILHVDIPEGIREALQKKPPTDRQLRKQIRDAAANIEAKRAEVYELARILILSELFRDRIKGLIREDIAKARGNFTKIARILRNDYGIVALQVFDDKELLGLFASIGLEESPYGTTLQGAMLNQLRQVGKRAGANDFIDEKTGTVISSTDSTKIAFPNVLEGKFVLPIMTVPMQKVLSMYHEALCKILPESLEDLGEVTLNELEKYSKVSITRDEYMRLTKTKDRKTADQTIKDACNRLFEASYQAIVKQGNKTVEYEGRYFQKKVSTCRGGVYEMEFSTDFLRYCATTTPSAFHKGMYQIDGRYHPYAWGIGQKLRQHYEINRGTASGERLSVKKLLEAVPDIPTYEEVKSAGKHITQQIITPVERNLDELTRLKVLKWWEYSNAKGVPLTREQLESMGYQEWEGLFITFELNLPPQDRFIEAHKKKIEAAKKRAEKKNQITSDNIALTKPEK